MATTEFIPVTHEAVSEPAESPSMTFEQMYNTYHDQLVAYMHRKFTNLPNQEHEEVVQDAMIKAMTHFDSYVDLDNGGERQAWIYSIVARTAIDRIRKNTRHATESASDMYAYEGYADTRAESEFDSIYSRDGVDEALAQVASVLTEKNIKEGWLEMFKLYAIEDKTDQEIAEQLEMNKTTVRTRIFRLRKRLADNAVLREMYDGESTSV